MTLIFVSLCMFLDFFIVHTIVVISDFSSFYWFSLIEKWRGNGIVLGRAITDSAAKYALW